MGEAKGVSKVLRIYLFLFPYTSQDYPPTLLSSDFILLHQRRRVYTHTGFKWLNIVNWSGVVMANNKIFM